MIVLFINFVVNPMPRLVQLNIDLYKNKVGVDCIFDRFCLIAIYVGIVHISGSGTERSEEPPNVFLATTKKFLHQDNPPRHGTISAIKVP